MNTPPAVRFPIAIKLISILSLLLLVSLGVMIALATMFFRADSETRVKENNHKLAELVADRFRADLGALIMRTRLQGSLLEQARGGDGAPRLLDDEQELLSCTLVFPGRGTGPSFMFREVMEAAGIEARAVSAALAAGNPALERAWTGETAVWNASAHFSQPVGGIAIPLAGRPRALVAFFRLHRFQKAVQGGGGITELFVVGSGGEVLVHPDQALVFAAANLGALPIVHQLARSTIDNGQTRYHDATGVAWLGSFRRMGLAGLGVVAAAREDRVFAEVYNIQRRNILLTLIVLSVGVLVVYFFARTLSRPLVSLMAAAGEIERGKFILKIKPSTHDEIGSLTSTFVQMGKGLAEREKMKEAFGKFVNKEIAELVMKGELKLGGERKHAAVFFSDIRSFTAISEKLEPEEVVEFLNEYMTRMVDCVNRTHGVVDKFIGDAVMAVWGAPTSHGNDTANAIDGALMMRATLAVMNKGRGKNPKKPLIRIGCGINTGPVLAGQIGSTERMEYTVIGDAVNLASRVETLNKPFATDILISADSHALVKDLFRVQAMPPIMVKGKSGPQTIYAVLGRKNDPQCPKSLTELRKRLGIPDPGRIAAPTAEETKYKVLPSKPKKGN